jgi:hypothetical protein
MLIQKGILLRIFFRLYINSQDFTRFNIRYFLKKRQEGPIRQAFLCTKLASAYQGAHRISLIDDYEKTIRIFGY